MLLTRVLLKAGLTIPKIGYEVLIVCLPFKQSQMPRDKRQKQDLHALDGDGMVLCNPRDKEAALRAQTEKIATDNWKAVTCGKCLSLIYKLNKAKKLRKEVN